MPDKVDEKNEINTVQMLFDIKTDLANLNTKVDSFKEVDKKADKASDRAEKALEVAHQNEHNIKEIQQAKDDSSNNHNQWWIAMISAIAGGLSGIIGNFIH